ncbi:hypothetical protein [Nonomuraea sp. NPDC050643]|uniref:hypothetical protein n=1 Tax=Nonomuraea sp. NPDC050643 TaxID=3155660 RepID=UPI0033EDC648
MNISDTISPASMDERCHMKKGLALLLVAMTGIGGCGGYGAAGSHQTLDECYKEDGRKSQQLAREIGPLLEPDVRSTLHEGSACDSEPEGGAYVTYILDPHVPLKEVMEEFYSTGWVDSPQAIRPCPDSCIAGVGKKVDGGRIEATVEESDQGSRTLDASFIDNS